MVDLPSGLLKIAQAAVISAGFYGAMLLLINSVEALDKWTKRRCEQNMIKRGLR